MLTCPLDRLLFGTADLRRALGLGTQAIPISFLTPATGGYPSELPRLRSRLSSAGVFIQRFHPNAVIAQLVERLPCKQDVAGSMPAGGSKDNLCRKTIAAARPATGNGLKTGTPYETATPESAPAWVSLLTRKASSLIMCNRSGLPVCSSARRQSY